MDHFEAASPLMFRQRYLFKILLSDRSLRHMELCNKGKLMREFDTEDLVIIRKHVKSSIKYGIEDKLVFKTNGPYRVLEKAAPSSYWHQHLPF